MPVEVRFWEKVDRGGDCWEWLAAVRSDGYGTFRLFGRMVRPHRYAYELLVGPIPDGLHLDHLCRNRTCVNPEHLEPVTLGENVLRGLGPSATNTRKTHCPRGHELAPYQPGAKRRCRPCDRAAVNRSAAKRRARERGDLLELVTEETGRRSA